MKSENTPPDLSISLPQREPLPAVSFLFTSVFVLYLWVLLKLYRKDHGINTVQTYLT